MENWLFLKESQFSKASSKKKIPFNYRWTHNCLEKKFPFNCKWTHSCVQIGTVSFAFSLLWTSSIYNVSMSVSFSCFYTLCRSQACLWDSALYSETRDPCASFSTTPEHQSEYRCIQTQDNMGLVPVFQKHKVKINVEEQLAHSFGSHSFGTVSVRRINATEWIGFLQQSLIRWLGLGYAPSFIMRFRQ